jgi:Pyruvate/2-oxoacid:ferredoxin oxidoreductase delta subunit
MKNNASITRRQWLRALFSPKSVPCPAAGSDLGGAAEKDCPDRDGQTMVAVIMGRHCLACQQSFCSVCLERCPIPGAIISTRGIPRVNPALCDGCGLCIDVCPAPEPAIRLFPKRPTSGISPAPKLNTTQEMPRPRHLDRLLGRSEPAENELRH